MTKMTVNEKITKCLAFPLGLLDAEIRFARWFDTKTGVAVTLRRNEDDTSFAFCGDGLTLIEETKTYPAPLTVVPIEEPVTYAT